MIRNERQYRTTLRQRQMLAEALSGLGGRDIPMPSRAAGRRPKTRPQRSRSSSARHSSASYRTSTTRSSNTSSCGRASSPSLTWHPLQTSPTRWYAPA